MSIISQALAGKTSWATAAGQIGQWFSQILGQQPTAQATVQAGQLMSDLKQTASDAVSLSETLMGPLLSVGAAAIEGAVDTALKAAIGPVSGLITPAIDTAISDVEAQFVAAVQSRTTAFRASLAVPATTVAAAPPPIQTGSGVALSGAPAGNG